MDFENITQEEIEVLALWKPLDKTQKDAVIAMMKAMQTKN